MIQDQSHEMEKSLEGKKVVLPRGSQLLNTNDVYPYYISCQVKRFSQNDVTDGITTSKLALPRKYVTRLAVTHTASIFVLSPLIIELLSL